MNSTAEDSATALSIGIVVGGTTAGPRAWRAAIRDLMQRVVRAREGVETPLNVNVVFHVPGEVSQPGFVGPRTGTFSKRRMLLMVQVGVPEEPPPDVDGYVRDAAYTALGEAERWAVRRGVADDLSALRGVLDRV